MSETGITVPGTALVQETERPQIYPSDGPEKLQQSPKHRVPPKFLQAKAARRPVAPEVPSEVLAPAKRLAAWKPAFEILQAPLCELGMAKCFLGPDSCRCCTDDSQACVCSKPS